MSNLRIAEGVGSHGLFRVEHKIPMPIVGTKRRKYPWYQLEVGDSFLVPCGSYEVKDVMYSLTSCKRAAKRRSGRDFAMRSVEGGVRVWRIS